MLAETIVLSEKVGAYPLHGASSRRDAARGGHGVESALVKGSYSRASVGRSARRRLAVRRAARVVCRLAVIATTGSDDKSRACASSGERITTPAEPTGTRACASSRRRGADLVVESAVPAHWPGRRRNPLLRPYHVIGNLGGKSTITPPPCREARFDVRHPGGSREFSRR